MQIRNLTSIYCLLFVATNSSEIEKILGYIESEHCVESITSLRRLEV